MHLLARWSTLLDLMEFNGYDMILFGYYLILLGFRVQELSAPLVVVLINFVVKKQVPKISFKGFEEGEKCASTSSVEHTLGYDMEFIGSDMILFGYDLVLLGSRVQYILVPLVVVLFNFGVKKQVPKISFKGFEEGDHCASASSVEHTPRCDMDSTRYNVILFESNIILLVSVF